MFNGENLVMMITEFVRFTQKGIKEFIKMIFHLLIKEDITV